MPADVRAFFDRYRSAFDALDGEAVARLYAVPSGIASESGYLHWPVAESIRDNMVALCDLYRANGFVSAEFEPVAFIDQGVYFAAEHLVKRTLLILPVAEPDGVIQNQPGTT